MRLVATMRCDLRLQWRNGFYYASAAVVICSIIVLKWLPDEAAALLLPFLILQNVMVNTFYFMAGLILLENTELTRAAQAVTPLRRGEYLASKVITLGGLSVVESMLIMIAAQGAGPGLLLVAIGIALASVVLTLLGAAAVCRYQSLNEFMMPSVVWSLLLWVPLLGWFGVGAPALYDWHPIQGPLQLIIARIEPLSAGRTAYAIVWPLLCVVPLYLWSRRAVTGSVRT